MSIASHSIIILSDLKLYEMNFEAIIKYLESQEYKVIQELGEGTFGVVYSTENASKNPTYSAMKISLYKEKHQTQYRRELNILSNQKLSRQFIVQYYSSDGEVLSSLKAAIERSTNKLLQSEDLLFQEKVTNSKAKLVPLKCDEDVKRMFQEAEQVSIMVVKKDQPIEL